MSLFIVHESHISDRAWIGNVHSNAHISQCKTQMEMWQC